jgi:hypothetical protein
MPAIDQIENAFYNYNAEELAAIYAGIDDIDEIVEMDVDDPVPLQPRAVRGRSDPSLTP